MSKASAATHETALIPNPQPPEFQADMRNHYLKKKKKNTLCKLLLDKTIKLQMLIN